MTTVSRGTKAERFRFIEQNHKKYGITKCCHFLNISPSGYCAWCNRGESKRASEERELILAIRNIFYNSRETYGSPRVHKALRREDIRVGRKRVERIMREHGLMARVAQTYPAYKTIIQHYMAITNKQTN